MIEHGFDAGGSVGMDEVAESWDDLTGHRLTFLAKLADLDRDRGFEYDGHTSTAAFLMHRCGMSARRARREVFLARSLERMRLVWSSVASGRLSFDQAVVLAFAQHRPPRPLRRRRGDAGGRVGLVGRHGPTKLDNLIRQHHPPQRTPTPKPDTPPGVTDQSAPRL